MKTQSTTRQCLRWLFVVCLGAAFATATAFAQSATTGTIVGRVYNPATGEYMRNAEVRLVGTSEMTTSAADGSFTLSNVAPGAATIQVTYAGYDVVTTTLNVTAGSTATADINLTTAGAKEEGPIKMDAFTVSTERQGNSKAIQDQKQAMTVSNIVAAENFGNTAEGNVGEFLKYMPGIQMDYVEADARNPRIRGLPAQYTQVTFGGMDLASADGFIQNNGTDNGGGAGAGGRSFGFEQVSMSSVDSVEVDFTTNASQSAGAAAGSIDLRPKHAYQRSGQRIVFDVSAMGNSEEMFWHKVVKPDDRQRRLILPNGSFEFSNSFLNHRLGVIFSVNESNVFNEQRQFVPTYDANPTATDPRPLVVTRLQYKDGPKLTERSTMSFTVDYKVSPRLSLSLIGTLNYYSAMTSNRNFGVTSTRANVAGDGWTQWTNVPITGITTSWSYLRKRTHGYTYLPMFEYKLDRWLITGSAALSSSENNYANGQAKSLPGSAIGGVSLPTAGMTVSAWRPEDDLYAWRITQTGGSDWSNLANYKASSTAYPTFGWDGRYNRVLKYQAKIDAKYTTPWSIPTWLKGGANVQETTYIFQNPTNWLSWNFVGPGGGKGGSWGNYPSLAVFSPGHGGYFDSMSGGTPAIADHNIIGQLWLTNPEYFQHNDSPGNYYSAFVANPKYIKEQVDALYGMFDSRPLRRVEVQAGLRWERTRDETKDFNSLPASQVIAAGYTVNTTSAAVSGIPSQVANTIPGIQYQFFSAPRSAHSNHYDKIFPSGGVKFDLLTNLQLLLGYSYTVTRPAFGDLSGTYTENETTQEINAPNPLLKPQYSDNYSVRLMWYPSPREATYYGVSVFENDIKNFTQTSRIPGAASDYGFTDPIYDTYTVVTKTSLAGKVIYRGATVEFNQSLSFLPKPFDGLNLFANYTRTYTLMRVPDPTQLHVSGSPYNFGWIPGVAPHVINVGASFKYKRATVGVKAHWTADMPTTSTYNTWMQQNTKYDVNFNYRLNRTVELYFYSRNVTNVPDHTYVGTNRQRIGGGRAFEYYGAYLYAGVKATF